MKVNMDEGNKGEVVDQSKLTNQPKGYDISGEGPIGDLSTEFGFDVSADNSVSDVHETIKRQKAATGDEDDTNLQGRVVEEDLHSNNEDEEEEDNNNSGEVDVDEEEADDDLSEDDDDDGDEEEEGDDEEDSDEDSDEEDSEEDDEEDNDSKSKSSNVSDDSGKRRRDLSMFPDDYKKHMRGMSNKAYNFFKKRIPELETKAKEADELREGLQLPSDYKQHPRAFVLSPKFQALLEANQSVALMQAHYIQQLNRVENGESWEDIEGINEDGTFKKSRSQDPDDDTAGMLREKINAAQRDIDANNAEIGKVKESFQKDYDEEVKLLRDNITSKYPWVADPKKLKDVVEINGKKASIEEWQNAVSHLIPPHMKNHPLAEIIINTAVRNGITTAENKRLRAEIKKSKRLSKDSKRSVVNRGGKSGTKSPKKAKEKATNSSWGATNGRGVDLSDMID